MRTIHLVLSLLSVILMAALTAACNPETPEVVATEAATVPALEEAPAPGTREIKPPPTSEPGGYPGSGPTPTSRLPEGYPEPVKPTSPANYPGDDEAGRVWILRPFGVQCSEAVAYEFASLDEAVRSLEATGIEVFGAEVVGLMVCESCDCPTSEHYRAQIGAENLATALAMGWSLESGG